MIVPVVVRSSPPFPSFSLLGTSVSVSVSLTILVRRSLCLLFYFLLATPRGEGASALVLAVLLSSFGSALFLSLYTSVSQPSSVLER